MVDREFLLHSRHSTLPRAMTAIAKKTDPRAGFFILKPILRCKLLLQGLLETVIDPFPQLPTRFEMRHMLAAKRN